MSLIMAKNKVESEQLELVPTPEPTDTHTPIPHSLLADRTRDALGRAGFEITEEEHALGRGGLRYFGGFALKGEGIDGNDRKLVLGLRNAHDKSFAASVCIGNHMMVCENLCFSSDVKLARRHTVNILRDLNTVLSSAVSRVVSHWTDMGKRIDAYKGSELSKERASDLVVDLAEMGAFPARSVYKAVQEFRNPRHEEFKGGTLWTLYNGVTEHLKGGDLSKLPQRTMTTQSLFDKIAGHTPEIVDAQEIALPA
jgi:hypothetical protein|tara:strand:- start:215 stop:976 length:762 start_codon:yes stop_codon:yes gene_type:complete